MINIINMNIRSILLRYKYKLAGVKSLIQFYIYGHSIKKASGKIIILFHGIDFTNSTRFNSKFISVKKFEKLLLLMKKYFEIVDLKTLCNDSQEINKIQVCLTFDDGFENNYLLARPILEKHKVPATFFISRPQVKGYDILWADLIDLSSRFAPTQMEVCGIYFYKNENIFYDIHGETLKNHCKKNGNPFIEAVYQIFLPFTKIRENADWELYWKLMTEGQLLELAKNPLFAIGSHAIMHSSLQVLSKEEAKEELSISKKVLEAITQQPIEYFAYPDGHASKENIQAARDTGYKYQFLANASDLDQLPDVHNRLGVNPYVSPKALLFQLYNGYN